MRLVACLGCVLILCAFSGCTPWTAFVDSLNTRQIQSCLSYRGHAGPYVTLRGLTVTGGAPWDACAALFPGGLE